MDFEKLGHAVLDSTREAIIQELSAKKTTIKKIMKIKVLGSKIRRFQRRFTEFCYIYATKGANVVFFQKIGLLLSQNCL